MSLSITLGHLNASIFPAGQILQHVEGLPGDSGIYGPRPQVDPEGLGCISSGKQILIGGKTAIPNMRIFGTTLLIQRRNNREKKINLMLSAIGQHTL